MIKTHWREYEETSMEERGQKTSKEETRGEIHEKVEKRRKDVM